MNTTTETTTAHESDEIFGVGEPCGVCIFPTGEGEICGNTVYANQAKGRLPKYCGQEGQAEWQAKHGTEGNPRHRSDLAGYPRRQLGMTPEDVQTLAAAEAARRGITRRTTKAEAAAPAPAAEVPAGPTAPADLAEALPESAVDALAELARLITGRVVAVRHEMDAVRTEFEQRTEELEREAEQRAADLAAEREAVEADRAKLAELTERAESEIRAANDDRLRVEGELAAARRRVAELEAALAESEARRVADVEEVRRFEREEFRRTMREFAATVRGEREEEATAVVVAKDAPITAPVVARMAVRIERGDLTLSKDGRWLLGNADAIRPAVNVIEHMMKAGYLAIGEGKGDAPAPVTLTDEYRKATAPE